MGSVKIHAEITIVQWNARSISGYKMQHKKGQLINFLKTFKNTPQVVCLQETWNKSTKNPVTLKGYKNAATYKRKNNEKGGGTSIYVQEGLDFEEIKYRQQNENLEIAIIRLFGLNKNLDIISLYTNGNTLITKEDYEHVLSHVSENHIIVGDFNVRDSLWEDKYTHDENEAGKNLINFIEENNLVILNNGEGTRLNIETGDVTALDLTLAARGVSQGHQWYVHQNCLDSDHYPIITILNAKYKCVTQDTIPKWNLSKADWTHFKKLTENINIDFENNSLEKNNETFIHELQKISAETIPKTKPNPNKEFKHVPWWTKECTEAVKNKNKAFYKYRKYKTNDLKEIYKTERANCKAILENTKKNKWQEFISTLNHKTDSKTLWNKISRFNGKPFKPVDVLNADNIRHHENIDKANVLVKHYQKISSNTQLEQPFKDRKKDADPEITVEINAKINDKRNENYNTLFTIGELKTALNKKKSTAPGADTIHYDMLKNSSEKCKWQILKLINKSWVEGKLPTDWKIGTITPLLKPHKPRNEPASYRPISLTSCICKVMETMIGNRLNSFLEKNDLMAPTQSGFRKNRSTLDQIIRLQSEILKARAENRLLLCVFLDLEKAFDLMWTNGVLLQLTKLGITGRLLAWIKDFLKDRKIQVRVGTENSELLNVENGSPQGSVLSPTLFNILMNTQYDALKALTGNLTQFADDSAIWKTAKSKKALVTLTQTILNNIKTWADTWGFKVSADKTESVLFNHPVLPDDTLPKLKLGDKTINYKREAKFLGMTLDNQLTWKSHITALVNKCKKDLNLMRYLSGTKYGADKLTLTKIYNALIRSKLDYGSQAYNTASKHQLDRLDRIQSAALRIITGAYKTTPNAAVQIECNIPPLALRREENSLKYWARSSILKDKLPLNNLYGTAVYETRKHRIEKHLPFPAKIPALLEKYKIQDAELQAPTYQTTFNMTTIEPKATLSKMICKKTASTQEIEEKAKKYIHKNYRNSLQIFTDGSKDQEKELVGCAYTIPEINYTNRFKLNKNITIFSAELTAIIEALKWIKENKPQKVVILTDSLSAIQTLQVKQCNSRPDLILQILELIDQVIKNETILNIDWCPSHCNIAGNDKADEAAKIGSSTGNKIKIKLGKTEIYSIIKKEIRKHWATNWKNYHGFRWELEDKLPTKIKQYSDSRQYDRLYTRLRLGINGLKANNQTYGEMDPLCPHCGDIEDTEHYLLKCTKHTPHRTKMLDQIKQTVKADNLEINLKLLLNPHAAHAKEIIKAVCAFIADTGYNDKI